MTAPWGNPPQLPGTPRADLDDPLRFDRADVDDTADRQAGARRRRGFRVTGRGTTSPATEPVDEPTPQAAPGKKPPFDFRELAARHITAAQLDAMERGAA
ncbi:hypothetical protein [Micromonospora chalcea]|uniref:hypothetical protein n=1 Tax=Micromonospora chalcea TaxID=1874 RepID=UPI0037A33DFF